MRRIIALLLLVSVTLALSGCFLYGKTNRKITTYFDDDTEVVAARVWYKDFETGEIIIIEVPEDQLDALIEEIDKTPLISHIGHSDYFYKGRYGIELTLSDGNYLIYDCTQLELCTKPFDKKGRSSDDIKYEYLEDADRDFWDRISQFVPGMDPSKFSYGWS